MRPEDRDTGYLWDMLDAARAIRDFTVDVTLDEYRRAQRLRIVLDNQPIAHGLVVRQYLIVGVSNGPVTAQPPLEHSKQHRRVAVHVVEDTDFGLPG